MSSAPTRAGLGLLALLAACSPAEPASGGHAGLPSEAGSKAGAAQTDGARAPLGRAPSAPPAGVGAWRPRDAPWLAEMRERLDPTRSGWPIEGAAQRLEGALGPTLTQILGARPVPDQLAGLFTDEDGALDELLPARATLFDDGSVRVSRAPPRSERAPLAGDEPAGLARLAAGFARWRAALVEPAGEGAEPRVEARLVGASADENGALRAEVVLRAWASGERGAVQQNARWRLTCERDAQGAPGRILALEVLELEEIVAPATWLCEITAEVFGALEAWPTELASGNDALVGRADRMSGELVLGMHGVGLGDVDGDGREDLYVAQPAGEPNLLLLRTADGGLRETGRDSGAALLDATLGVLVVDLDGDGHDDLVCSVGPDVVVLWNDGGGRFTERSWLTSGDASNAYSLSAADADGDLDLDLYVCRYSVGEYIQGRAPEEVPVPYHDARNGAPNLLWLNDGVRRFHEGSAELGFDVGNSRFSLASIWEDLDGDGELDLYVVNDFGRNQLYRRASGPEGVRYTDAADERGLEDMAAGMGVSIADVDLDGELDLLVSNMYAPAGMRMAGTAAFLPELPELRPHYERHARGNTLLLGAGGGRYRDATAQAGVGPGGWAWGARFLDFNGDGLEDFYVPDGFVSGRRRDDLESYFWRECVARTPPAPPVTWEYYRGWSAIRYLTQSEGWSWNGHERNFGYLNLGEGRFADVSAALGADELDDGRVALALDWDEDGREDLLLRNRTGPRLRLWRNAHPAVPRVLTVELAGESPNTDAIGARVELELRAGERLRRASRRVYAGDGYLGNSSRRLRFVLGEDERVESARVRWPDGSVLALAGLEPGARWRIDEATGAQTRVARFGPGDADARCERLPTRPFGLRSRVVLLDRLPLAPLSLALLNGSRGELVDPGEHAGLVVVGTWSDPRTRARIEALAARRAELEAQGIGVALWLADPPEVLESAGPALAALELEGRSARLDAAGVEILRTLVLEIVGPGDGLPLPVVLVVDRAAELCALHAEPWELELVLADAARATKIDPALPDSGPFLGGIWLRQPERALGVVVHSMQLLGQADLARAYEALIGARAAR